MVKFGTNTNYATFKLISFRKIIQAIESIPWVRCASGNVFLQTSLSKNKWIKFQAKNRITEWCSQNMKCFQFWQSRHTGKNKCLNPNIEGFPFQQSEFTDKKMFLLKYEMFSVAAKRVHSQSGSDGIPVPDPTRSFFQLPDPSRPENWKWPGSG